MNYWLNFFCSYVIIILEEKKRNLVVRTLTKEVLIMAQISTHGYNDLKEYVAANWNHIAVYNSSVELFRISTSDSRVTVGSTAVNPLTITLVLTGSDSELASLPKAVDAVGLFKASAEGECMTGQESFTSFTFEQAADKLTIEMKLEVPAL